MRRSPPTSAGRRSLPLLRGSTSRTGGSISRSTGTPSPTTSTSRSAWSRSDHPVELPDPHGRVELARTRRRQRGGAQAGRADSGVDPVRDEPSSATSCPTGVINVVNGFGVEAGKPLASSNRIRKIAFTGETTTGRLIMQYASENLIPVTSNSVASPRTSSSAMSPPQDDGFLDRALEGFCDVRTQPGAKSAPARAVRSSRATSTTTSSAGRSRRVKAIKQATRSTPTP